MYSISPFVPALGRGNLFDQFDLGIDSLGSVGSCFSGAGARGRHMHSVGSLSHSHNGAFEDRQHRRVALLSVFSAIGVLGKGCERVPDEADQRPPSDHGPICAALVAVHRCIPVGHR